MIKTVKNDFFCQFLLYNSMNLLSCNKQHIQKLVSLKFLIKNEIKHIESSFQDRETCFL